MRVVTWNVFHLRDEDGVQVSWRDPFRRGRPAPDGRVHLNLKLDGAVAAVLASLTPDICLLQEMTPTAINRLGRALNMRSAWAARTGPFVGPLGVRDAIGRWNPDLVRTHEGNANVIMLGSRVAGLTGARLRLNPWREVLTQAWQHRDAIGRGPVWRWLCEVRVAVAARVLFPCGTPVTVVCVHLHNARSDVERRYEVDRLVTALARIDGPLILGGDLNMMPDFPHMNAFWDVGLEDPAGSHGQGIDRLLTRGLEVKRAAVRVPTRLREVWWDGRPHPGWVRVSDHDPVVIEVRTRP